MTRGTGYRQIIRAAEESIAYQCYDVVKAMEADYGSPVTVLRVDGGASSDDFLMQVQADLLDGPVECPVCRETTALGVAAMAALALGWQSLDSLASRPTEKRFVPAMADGQRQRLLTGWRKAVSRAKQWETGDPL